MTKTMIPAGMSEKMFTAVAAAAPNNKTMPNRGYGPGFRTSTDGMTSHQKLDKVWPRVQGGPSSKKGSHSSWS